MFIELENLVKKANNEIFLFLIWKEKIRSIKMKKETFHFHVVLLLEKKLI